jgi:lysophospholipase L1-like esterase
MAWIWIVVVVCFGSAFYWGYRQYQNYVINEDPAFWEREISRIEKRYQGEYPQDVVVCYGSSSIRFWKTIEEDLAPLPVVNHGFGGSKINDATYYVDRMVLPFSPRAVVLFSGTNDLSQLTRGEKDGLNVYQGFVDFVEKVEISLPELPIFYITITPTRARWSLWPEAEKANQLITEFATGKENITIIDPTQAFLGEDGLPRKYLFRLDRLHPNKQGYAVWTSIIKPILVETLG